MVMNIFVNYIDIGLVDEHPFMITYNMNFWHCGFDYELEMLQVY